MEINVLVPSIALGTQLVSLYFAFRLMRFAEKRVVAIVFILAVSLMALRRWISLERIIAQGDMKIDLFEETVALSISVLVLYGIISIARIFKSEEENKKAAASAEMRYRTHERLCGRTVRNGRPAGRYGVFAEAGKALGALDQGPGSA